MLFGVLITFDMEIMMTVDQINQMIAAVTESFRDEEIDILYDELMMERELQKQYEMMSLEADQN